MTASIIAAAVRARAGAILKAAVPLASSAWSWARRNPVLVLLVVLIAAHDAWQWSLRRTAESALLAAQKRETQESKARQAQLPVVEQAPQADVDNAAEEQESEDPALHAELERARNRIGELRALLIVRARTAAGPVHASPAPVPPPVAGPDGKLEPVPCDLYQDQALRLGADLALVQGDAGAQLALGTLSAWRVTDDLVSDDVLLFRQAWTGPLTKAIGEVRPALERPAWWAVRAGGQWNSIAGRPGGGYAGGDLRLFGTPAWITADVGGDERGAAFRAGLRWEGH